jgi:hypothetical protein
MRVRKRTEITIETDRVLIIRRRRSVRVWCQECGSQTDMVDLREAEALSGLSGRVLRDRAEAGRCHVLQGHDGASLVCLESLLKSM